MNAVTILLLCLGASYLLSSAFKKIRLPVVLGPIFIGFLLGIPVLKELLFLGDLTLMESFADIGLLFLMFYVGLQLESEKIRENIKGDALTALLAFVVPFLTGFFIATIFDMSRMASVIIGAIFAIISETVPVEILEELNLIKTKVGEKLLFLGTISDFIVTLEIIILVALIEGQYSLQTILLKIFLQLFIFATVIYLAIFLLAPFLLKQFTRSGSKKELFILTLILVFALASIAEYLELGSILGALVAGIVVRNAFMKAEEEESEEELSEFIDMIAFGLFAPFFFIWIGLNTDINAVFANPVLGIVLLMGVMLSKVVGVFIARVFTKEPHHEMLSTGFGIAILGGVDLIFAEIARSNGVISNEIFSAIVFMSVLTVLIAPILFQRVMRNAIQAAPEAAPAGKVL